MAVFDSKMGVILHPVTSDMRTFKGVKRPPARSPITFLKVNLSYPHETGTPQKSTIFNKPLEKALFFCAPRKIKLAAFFSLWCKTVSWENEEDTIMAAKIAKNFSKTIEISFVDLRPCKDGDTCRKRKKMAESDKSLREGTQESDKEKSVHNYK